jgi:hypothetical protein
LHSLASAAGHALHHCILLLLLLLLLLPGV